MPKSKKPRETRMEKTSSFEDKLKKLREVVENLERGDVSLKESMDTYQQSLDIIKQCNEELENAELKIEKIMKKEGRIITETLEK